MATLYVTEQRALVQKEGDCLVVVVPEDKQTGAARRRVEVPLLKIEHVLIFGNVTVTAPALHALLENQVEIAFLSRTGALKGTLSPSCSKNSLIRLAQHRTQADAARRLDLARRFVAGKLANMRTLLLRGNRKRQDATLAAAAAGIKDALGQVGSADSVASLLGVEGTGSAAYFSGLRALLNRDLGFKGRARRPPTDPVNAMLSFGYVLLTNQIAATTHAIGLDPYIGFLHTAQYGRPSLALDLVEEFRPVIVDSIVLTAINTGAIGAKDFEEELGTYRLTDSARREFLLKFEERLNTPVAHPVFKYQATYRRCLELQARLLSKYLTEEITAYIPFLVR